MIPLLRFAFFGCAAAVLYLALVPQPAPVPLLPWDKAQHALAFTVLGLLGAGGWPARFPWVLAGLFGFGCAIELLQHLGGTRTAELRDVVADSAGLAIAAVLVALRRRLQQRRGAACSR